jgi:hypothetical protein
MKQTKKDLGDKYASRSGAGGADREDGRDAGPLGRKNGKGFYDYPEGRARSALAGPGRSGADTISTPRASHDRGAQAAPPGIARRVEAARCYRGGRDHRPARGRCRLDPRLRLRALDRRPDQPDRRHRPGQGLRRGLRRAWLRSTASASRRRSCCARWPPRARPSTAASASRRRRRLKPLAIADKREGPAATPGLFVLSRTATLAPYRPPTHIQRRSAWRNHEPTAIAIGTWRRPSRPGWSNRRCIEA